MATSLINNGMSGLIAAQAGILTTSHNISNSSTPGYSRQTIVQTTNQPMQTGSGFFGQGTSVQNVQRVFSQFLAGSVLAAETQSSQMDSYLSQIQQIDNMLGDSSAGLSPALSDFFKGVQDVAANPSSIPARQSMLSMAQALAARFQAINQSLDEQRQGVGEQITSEVSLINSYASQIANLNQQIVLANSSAGNAQQPNDLLDQRDHLVEALNKEIHVTTVTQTDGTISVFIGNGQPVVMNTGAFALVAKPSNSDPQETAIGIQSINNNAVIELQQSLLTGGTLGGLLAFEREALDPAQNALGRMAIALAQNFNQQQNMGQDLNGQIGRDLFSFPTNTANTMYAYTNLYPNKTNKGVASLSAQVLQSDYRVVYNNVSGNYDVYRLNANLPMAAASGAVAVASFAPGAGNSITIDGVTITDPVGTAQPGDAFTIKPGNPLATRIIPDSTNSAGGNVNALASTQAGNGGLTGADYRIDYTGVTPTAPLGFVVTRLSDNAVLTPTVNAQPSALGPPATTSMTFDGVTVLVPDVANGGSMPIVGDSFILQPTRNAARDITVNISDPALIAAGAPFRTRVDSANQGTAAIDVGSMVVRDPNSIPLAGPVTLTYDSPTNTWAVSGPAPWNGTTITSTNFTPGQQNVIDLNGVRFTVWGIPQTGDKLYLEPNAGGIADNRNAQAMGALQTTRLLAGNTASYEEAYSQIVSQIGNKTREVKVTGQAQQTLADEANSAVQQLSGVNLDEEASNLIRYQQAYQASAKMIDVGNKLFDTFLSAIG